MSTPLVSPRLRNLIRRATEAPGEASALEPCGLCSAPVPPEHRHLLDLRDRSIHCSCRACALLFDAPSRPGSYRLIPERRIYIESFRMDAAGWNALRIPVELAFLTIAERDGEPSASYPGPAGVTRARLARPAWERIIQENPVLQELGPEVEALLVHRVRGARHHWIVPIDDCFRLVARIRSRWRGFGGGGELWSELDHFFEELWGRSVLVRPDGTALASEA